MSTDLRKKIAYWFFLVAGFVGVILFTYQFFATDKYGFWEWLGICSVFSAFIFKPTLLLDIFDTIKNFFAQRKAK
ncbi:hypothetical protein [Flagellimonas sp. SN16]|uniref:hypothetical protein n=1 Tax=Flagellimonas sp. SN16 TaxID=3415142 RepID=UPI003C61F97C